MPDDFRFTPPGPQTGSHARFSARRISDGHVITDAIVDNGESAPKRRKFRTLAELREFIAEPMEGAAWPCGCAVLFDAIGDVRVYDPCARHHGKLTG